MQEDESVPEMFHRLQVIVNELKALGWWGHRHAGHIDAMVFPKL
jgi:hypothetical protein